MSTIDFLINGFSFQNEQFTLEEPNPTDIFIQKYIHKFSVNVE